jgi:hypothetical protein
MDELEAEPITQTEAGIVAKLPDGRMVEIDAEGNDREITEEAEPADVELDPEVFEGTAVEIEEAMPPEEALAVDVRDPSDVYRAMDRADEVMILEELMGRALDTMLYSFPQEGKTVTDLTVAGVNETVRMMNERGGTQIGISPQPPVVAEFTENGERFYRVMVFGRDARFPESGRWAASIEPAMMTKKDGSKKWDKFALTKALNKAQRNALKAFIPEDFRQHIIALYLNKGSVQELKRLGTGSVAELPPALDDDRAKEIKAEIEAAWQELNEINRQRMPPGRYNVYLTRAETDSHGRMEAFRDQIRELLAEEIKKREGAPQ